MFISPKKADKNKKNLVYELKLSDGSVLPYQIVGSGDPIIFIHGLFGKAEDYKEVIQKISKNYCCISFDLRGHGKSKSETGFKIAQFAKDLKVLIDSLFLINPSIVGYSTGALTLFSYLEQFGCNNLNKLVFVDITPKMINDKNWTLGLYRGEYHEEDYHRDLLTMNHNFIKFASFFTYRNMTKYNESSVYRKNANLLSKLLAKLLIGNNYKKQHMTSALWKDIAGCDFRNTLKTIKVPTAFFYADPGSLFSPDTAHYMQSQVLYDSITVSFKNASHALLFSHGEQFAKELIIFMKEGKTL